MNGQEYPNENHRADRARDDETNSTNDRFETSSSNLEDKAMIGKQRPNAKSQYNR